MKNVSRLWVWVCVFVFQQQSLVSKVSRRQRVDMNLLFLNIKVRRAQLLSDSLDEVSRHTHTHTHTHTLLSHLFQMIRLHNKDSIQIQRKVASEHLKVRSETFACWFVSNKLKRYFLRRFGVLSLCSAAEISALLSDIDDWPSASLFVEHQHVFLMLTPVAVSRCSHSPLSSAAGHIRLKIENRLQGFVKVCTKITGASLNDFPYLCEDTSQIILDDPSRPPSKAFSASIWQQDALMCITLRTLAWYFYFEREPEVKV